MKVQGKRFGEIRKAVKEDEIKCGEASVEYAGLADIEVILPQGMKKQVNERGEILLANEDRTVCISVYEDEFTEEGAVIADLMDAIEAADGGNFVATTQNVYGDFLWTGIVYQGGAAGYRGMLGRFLSVEPNDGKTFALVTIFDDTMKFGLLDFVRHGLGLKWKTPAEPKEDE